MRLIFKLLSFCTAYYVQERVEIPSLVCYNILMKCVILTNYPTTEEEAFYLTNYTRNCYKIAINWHASQYNPDVRICTDYILKKLYHNCIEPIISVRDRCINSPRVTFLDIEFKGATILAAIDYAKLKGYDNILLVADNTAHGKDFQELIKRNIINDGTVYQCSKGNFNLPVKSIKEWILN